LRRLIYLSLCAAGVAAAQPPVDQPPPPPAPDVPATPPAPVLAPAPEPAPPPQAPQPALPNYEPTVITLGGYLQPQFRKREDSPAQNDTDGFRFARARLIAQAKTTAGNLELSGFIEAEMQPDFSLQDGYISVARDLPNKGKVVVDGGQMRVPISRQNMLSDSRLSFVDKGQVATIAPGRDLGMRVAVTVPYAPQVRVWGGTFNGEGRNQVENINQRYLWATRVEVTPFGKERQLAESGFGGKFLTIAGSFGSQILDAGDRTEHIKFYGVDIAGSYRGLSGTFEYLYVDHDFQKGGDQSTLPPDFAANGWVAQLAYILPFHLPPHGESAFELGFRVEEIDRNDEVPISLPGDPEQSVRGYTGVASYYLRGHMIKAQLAVSHFTELEDMTAAGEDAAYDNDQLLLQVTYRLE
jgi:Phosphate-selective porin O and P